VKKWGVLVLMALAMFIIVIDTTIMNVSISALVADLDTTVEGIQAAIALYALVMASFILIGSKLADRMGRKRVFLLGLVIFGIGTTIASFAQNLTVLIIGWSILEGIGSALMLPNTQSILRGTYEGAARATAYGTVSAVAAAGAAFGPIVGGFLTTYASWRWAFRLEVVIVVIVLLLSGYIARDVLPATRPKFDLLGAFLSIVGLSCLVLGILMGQSYGFWLAKQPLLIGEMAIAPFGLSVVPFLIGIGILTLLGLYRWEVRQEQQGGTGLFKPSLFRLDGLNAGFTVRFCHMAIMAGFLFIVPLLLQLTFAFSAVQTGFALMPYSLGVLVFALVGARLSRRFSSKRLIQVGLLIGILGLLQLILTIDSASGPADLATGAVFGIGMGLVASQILNLILSSGTEADTAEIAGLNGTFEQLGNALGVALVGAIMLATLSAGLGTAVQSSTNLSATAREEALAAVEQSTQLVSDAQLQESLDAAGLSETDQQAIDTIYATERTRAFKAGMLLLTFFALAGLIMTTGLADRRLVQAET
jgi:MFS family permease